ncbi:hypothetical protein DCAR_0416036 [Daucus carota subsp. sativus]|uniref:Uncharacterized protein n=1 Tax=Daucus carota subsp. sativus TaxID=79200 RepID=A0A165X0U1_DAUCS|nr:hypothetical protein DCAR_0416036 [Daucus carota subsp. sativus]
MAKRGEAQQAGNKGNSRVSKLNQSRKRKGFPLFDNGAILSPEQIEAKEVCKYWFLLDWSMLEAFEGGNFRLLPLARARIEYLSKAIKPELLGKGLEGDEDSLWKINEILQNEGWWCKADNLQVREVLPSPKQAEVQNAALMGFLKAKEHLIHPNSRKQAFDGSPEGIRMALNQIHYGSLEESRKGNENKMPKDDLLRLTINFIRSWADLVEPSVLRDALRGNNRAISLALGQIHHHTLEPKKYEVHSVTRPYKEALLKESSIDVTPRKKMKTVTQPSKKRSHSVFFSGIQDATQPLALWQYFKKAGKVKDIILPKKRDKNGNRYGFLIMENGKEVDQIISKLSGKSFDSKPIYLAKAKDKSVETKMSVLGTESRKETPTKGFKHPDILRSTERMEGDHEHRGSEVSKSKADDQEVDIAPSADMLCITQQSLFLKTAQIETVYSATMIAESLGARNVQIRGISGTTFLAFFARKEDLECLDRELLSIGFVEVREIQNADLIPVRKTWVEIRGLPIMGISEENIIGILKDLGTVLFFGNSVDKESFYQQPKLWIETRELGEISQYKRVKLMGKSWRVRVVESNGDNEIYNEEKHLTPTVSDNSDGPANTLAKTPGLYDANTVKNVPKDSPGIVRARPEGQEALCSEHSLNSQKSTQSLVNPLTPRGGYYTFPKVSPVDKENIATPPVVTQCLQDAIPLNDQSSSPPVDVVPPSEQVELQQETFHTSNWIPRISKQSMTSSDSISANNTNTQLSSHDSIPTQLEDLQDSLINGISSMRVKSKRGRPRKHKQHPLNKNFKLPRKRKMRGEGLQQVSHFFLNNTNDEAEAIYETGLLMGLLPINPRKESLDLIRMNLAC